MTLRRASLHTQISLLFILLVFFALYGALSAFWQSREQHAHIKAFSEQMRFANAQQQILARFLDNKEIITLLKQGKTPTVFKTDYFATTQQTLTQQVNILFSQWPPRLNAQKEAINAAWQEIQSLLPHVEKNLALAHHERDISLFKQWEESANRFTALLEPLPFQEQTTPHDDVAKSVPIRQELIDKIDQNIVLFKRAVHQEFSIVTNALILEKSFDAHIRDTMRQARKDALHTWTMIEQQISPLTLDHPNLKSCFISAQRDFFKEFYASNDNILRFALQGKAPNIRLTDYLVRADLAAQALARFQNCIGEIAVRDTNTLLALNKQRTNTLLAITVTIALLAAAVALLLWKALTRPLHAAASENQPTRQTSGSHDQTSRSLYCANKCNLQVPHEAICAILASLPQAIIVTDLHGTITQFSHGAEKMLGYAADELVHQREFTELLLDQYELAEKAEKLSNALGLKVQSNFDFFVQQIKSHGSDQADQEYAFIRKDGKRLNVLLTSLPLYDEHAQLAGFLGIACDLSERKNLEQKLKERTGELTRQKSLFNALLTSVPAGVFIVEAPSRKNLILNEKALSILGMRRDDLRHNYIIRKRPDHIIYPTEELPLTLAMQGINSHVNDIIIITADSREHLIEATGTPVKDEDGNVWAGITCFIDISERAQESAEMSRLAYLDHLTQLPNRRLFNDRLKMSLSKARRHKTRIALLSIDLDKFKPVNDNLGHAVGDLLLQAVAQRMQGCLRESDTLARVGGDEFAVILPQITSDSDAFGVAEKIRVALNAPFDLKGGYNVNIACCIGIAIYPEHGKDETSLLHRADETMYAAKQAGRNRVTVCTEETGPPSETEKPLRHVMWRESYRCGNALIDNSLRQLFKHVNAVILALRANADTLNTKNVQRLMSTLIQHFTDHISEEESVLKNYDTPETADHLLKHQKVLAALRDQQSKVLSEEISVRDFMRFFVAQIMQDHVLKEDNKHAALLQTKAP